MGIGAGILSSTVLILLAIAIYQISARKKWKTVAKVFGAFVLLLVVLGAGIWGWNAYKARPKVLTELAGLRLGMTPLEVKLAKGAPTNDQASKPEQVEGSSLPEKQKPT
jgi:hypothetical protein